jgi:hypothetical protein
LTKSVEHQLAGRVESSDQFNSVGHQPAGRVWTFVRNPTLRPGYLTKWFFDESIHQFSSDLFTIWMKNSIFLSVVNRVDEILNNRCEHISMIRDQIEKIMHDCVVQFMIFNTTELIHVEHLNNIQIDDLFVDIVSTYSFQQCRRTRLWFDWQRSSRLLRLRLRLRWWDSRRNSWWSKERCFDLNQKKKSDLLRRSSDEDDRMIRESD